MKKAMDASHGRISREPDDSARDVEFEVPIKCYLSYYVFIITFRVVVVWSQQ
jgi:hypothetical protein